MAIPSNQLPIGGGLDSSGNAGASFFIDRTELDILQRDGPEWKLEDARFIPEVVQEPDAIFEGLRRPGQEKSLCYSVRPTRDPDEAEQSQVLPRYGFVFVVFVRSGIGGYVVFDWDWREEAADHPGHPKRLGKRFCEAHMVQNLKEYLETHPPQGFRPVPCSVSAPVAHRVG